MTSKFLRKRFRTLSSRFPCLYHRKRLKKVEDPSELGIFNLDKVNIAMPVFWRAEDLPGKSKGTKSKYTEDGEPGYLHQRKFDGYEYQIFQGLGRNRSIQFNPRHFPSLAVFKAFVEKIVSGRPYHITRVDFSWLLDKKYFSVSFLFCVIWRKGSKLFPPREYEKNLYKLINKGELSEFSIGASDFIIGCYDCDTHNSDKDRDEKKKVHGCINLEIQCRTKALIRMGICHIEDLEKINFPKVFWNVEFIEPSGTAFKNLSYEEELISVWKDEGATGMTRKLYRLSKANNYEIVSQLTKPLRINKMSLRKALICIGRKNLQDYLEGLSPSKRFSQRAAIYDMEPTFDL